MLRSVPSVLVVTGVSIGEDQCLQGIAGTLLMKEEYFVWLLIKISDDMEVKAEANFAGMIGETVW